MKIFTIIPAYNEGKSIENIIKKTKEYINDIIVVDDGSKDNTSKITKELGITVLRHVTNLGKGAALKTGCEFALKQGADIMIVMDADGQHDPKEIPRFIESIKDCDIVFGYRELTKAMPLILRLGNWFINLIIKMLYGIDIKDSQSGYKAFTSETYKKIRWDALNYSMESEIVANVGKHNLKYKEIQIDTIYHDRYKGTTMLDGIKIVFNLFWWKITGKKK